MSERLVEISFSYLKDEAKGYPKHVILIDGQKRMESVFDDKIKIEIRPIIKHDDGSVESIDE